MLKFKFGGATPANAAKQLKPLQTKGEQNSKPLLRLLKKADEGKSLADQKNLSRPMLNEKSRTDGDLSEVSNFSRGETLALPFLDFNTAGVQRLPKEKNNDLLEIKPMKECLHGDPCQYLSMAKCRKANGQSVFSLDACPLPGKRSKWFRPNKT